MAKNRFTTLLTSKTVWGTIGAVAAWLLKQPTLDRTTILQGAATVLAGVGVRDSVTKIIEAVQGPIARR